MNKYPYIGECMGNVVVFTGKDSGVSIVNSGCEQGHYSENWGETSFTNITHEYLASTYGEVKSPEHAEFIIELAESAEFKVYSLKRIGEIKTFAFENGELCLLSFHHEGLDSRKLEQIIIPLPPKAYKQEPSDWPKIGDEVLICNAESDSRIIDFNNEKVKVIAKTKDSRGTVLTITHPSQGIGAIMFINKYVKKPKTHEEELRDDIESIIFKKHAELATSIHVRNSLIEMSNSATEILLDEFEIKRKPQ